VTSTRVAPPSTASRGWGDHVEGSSAADAHSSRSRVFTFNVNTPPDTARSKTPRHQGISSQTRPFPARIWPDFFVHVVAGVEDTFRLADAGPSLFFYFYPLPLLGIGTALASGQRPPRFCLCWVTGVPPGRLAGMHVINGVRGVPDLYRPLTGEAASKGA
jgi:hypothetical protein